MLRAAQAGALRVAVAAMRAHPQVELVQLAAIWTLVHFGKGEANKHRAAEAGERAVVFAAVKAFPKIKRIGQHLLDVLPTRRERGQSLLKAFIITPCLNSFALT